MKKFKLFSLIGALMGTGHGSFVEPQQKTPTRKNNRKPRSNRGGGPRLRTYFNPFRYGIKLNKLHEERLHRKNMRRAANGLKPLEHYKDV